MAGIVLWDVDGTLVDSAQLHKDKIVAIAADPLRESPASVPAYGVAVTDSDWDDFLYGKADRIVYDWIVRKNPAFPLDRETFVERCEAYFTANAAKLKPRPGALEAFNRFAALGYYQAAVSSGTRAGIDASLQTIGIKDRLVLTIAEGDTAKSKPDPEPYEVAFARVAARMEEDGVSPPDKSGCLVIEDSATGAEAGGRSGITTIFWKHSAGKADSPYAQHNVTGAQGLLDLIQGLSGLHALPS
jgi:beta-phosphoglucomutase-like phosphatase (HAD superfamily)